MGWLYSLGSVANKMDAKGIICTFILKKKHVFVGAVGVVD